MTDRTGAEVFVSIPAAEDDRAAALSRLDSDLSALDPAGFAEVWVDHDPFPALCALINGPLGWLMVIRYSGDPGFSSRNPEYDGAPGSDVEFRLGNGQRDGSPASWAYPRDVLFDALRHFAHTRMVPPAINWFNDSGDGRSSPNDAFEEPM